MVMVAAATLTVAACSSNSNSSSTSSAGGGLAGSTAAASSGGLGGGSGSAIKIAFQGVLSGDNQQLGINEVNAVRLAVKQANDNNTYGFQVELLESDDGGTGDKAPAAAAKIIQDPAVMGMIGPSFSGATKAVGKTYGDAGLAFITPSASNATLQDQGFTTFHRVNPNDNVEGEQAAEWLARKGLKTVYVMDDLSDYGKGVADQVEKTLKEKGVTVTRQGVDAKTTDYTAAATAVKSSNAQALFYGGYDAQAALLAKALKAAGYTGLTVGGNGIKSSVFTNGAGDAGNGWYMTCGCQDATVAPEAKDFTAAYKAMFNTDPSTYSPEAYDATNGLLTAIKAAKDKGEVTRKTVLDAVNAVDYKGITTEVKFQANGEPAGKAAVNLYQQEGGTIKSLGLLSDQK